MTTPEPPYTVVEYFMCPGARPAVVKSYKRPMCLPCALNLISERAHTQKSFIGLVEDPEPDKAKPRAVRKERKRT